MLETVFHTTVMEYLPQRPELLEPTEPSNLGTAKIRLHLLVFDSDAAVRSACAEIASSLGYAVQSTADLAQARSLLRGHAVDILLINLPYGSHQILEVVSEVKVLHPATAVIAMTASSSVNAAVEAMRRGAADYLTKPFAVDELSAVLERAAATVTVDTENRQLRERLRLSQGLGSMIGRSAEMEKLYRILSKVAQSTHPVLVLGESGTGKELVARTIHAYGPNAYKPFLPVDCGSLVPTLIESELFGYVKGAFTGATKSKDGLFVTAEGGTVFLDEIGELTLDLQAKLLRALQEKEVRPVGATHRVPIKARIVAATNRDLASMVEKGTFRKDLFYRLNVVSLRMPALRERREDIPLLANYFAAKFSKRSNRAVLGVSPHARPYLTNYDWPGNVRELENAIERAVVLGSSDMILPEDLPEAVLEKAESAGATMTAFHDALREAKKQLILNAFEQAQGSYTEAARMLGLHPNYLHRLIRNLSMKQLLRQAAAE